MATAQFTPVANRDVGDPLTEPIWDDQLRDNINMLLGKGSGNLLVNGGVERWQRGGGPFTANAAVTADMWRIGIPAGCTSTISVTQEVTTVDSPASVSSLKCAYVQASLNITIRQRLEDVVSLRGKTIACSIRLVQNAASMARPYIQDSAGKSTGATVATTGSWVTLTVTRAIDAAATSLEVGIELLATGNAYLDNAMLVLGPAPAPYEPLHPADDMARCLRYYEVHGGVADALVTRAVATAGGQTFGQWFNYATPKAGTPTAALAGTWAVTNCGQPTVNFANTQGYELTAVSTAAGYCEFRCNSADDTVTAVYNP